MHPGCEKGAMYPTSGLGEQIPGTAEAAKYTAKASKPRFE